MNSRAIPALVVRSLSHTRRLLAQGANTVRGIYAREDETTPWMVEERFENGVPRFESKAECLEFIRAHCADREHPSNPDRTQARAPRAPPRTERARASRGGVPVDDRVPLAATRRRT